VAFKTSVAAGRQWLMPVILANQEAEIRRILVQSQPQQTVREILSQKTLHQVEGCCSLAPSLVRASFLSHSLLLLNLTGAFQDSEKTQDRQTDSGIRCVVHSAGDSQPSLFLFLYLDSLRPCSLQFFKPCLKPLSLGSLCPMFALF
jgi:hypothetical protein